MAKKKNKGELIQKEEIRPLSPFDEMERYFDDFMRNPLSLFARHRFHHPFSGPGAIPGAITPTIDIYEEAGNVVVKAEIPGISKEDLDVTITDNVVTIYGEKKKEEKVEKKDYYRMERSHGSFHRSVRLPENVNSEKAEASFKNGILEIKVPKSKESKQKKISIS